MWGTFFICVLHEPSAAVPGICTPVSACRAFPDSRAESWEGRRSLGRGSEGEGSISSLKDDAT